MRYATILLVGLAFTIAVAGCGGPEEAGTASPAAGPDAPSSSELHAQRTRDEVYHEGMSLEEIAAAATGHPGEIAPPCPDEATSTRLKEAGVAFGPCDLLPEKGAPVRIADPQTEPTQRDDDVVCPAIIFKLGLNVELPCGRGAKIVKAAVVEVDGSYCAKITYIAETGSPAITETLCEGDVPSAGGEPVTGPPPD
jgi:hypothetical protein